MKFIPALLMVTFLMIGSLILSSLPLGLNLSLTNKALLLSISLVSIPLGITFGIKGYLEDEDE